MKRKEQHKERMNEKEEGKKDTQNDGSSDFFVFSSFEYLEYEETDGHVRFFIFPNW